MPYVSYRFLTFRQKAALRRKRRYTTRSRFTRRTFTRYSRRAFSNRFAGKIRKRGRF